MHFCAEVPKILVGCKKDLRDDLQTIMAFGKMSQHPVTREEVSRIISYLGYSSPPTYADTLQGQAAAKKIGVVHYFECSASTGEGIRQVFCSAAWTAMASKPQRKKHGICVIL